MSWRLKANKTKMYQLVSGYCSVPIMKGTDFSFYRRTYWLSFMDTVSGHRMEACLSICCGNVYLRLTDLTDASLSRTIFVNGKEALERGLLEKV